MFVYQIEGFAPVFALERPANI